MTISKTQKRLLAGAATVAAGASLSRLRRRRRLTSFAGRVVLITGGSRGLGLLLARRFRFEGARLVLLARNKEELRRAQAELGGLPNTVAIVCDVSDRSQVDHAVELALQHFGRIDVLVNNAGIIQVGPLEHMSSDDFQTAMNVHFWGALNCMQAIIPHMRRRRSGRIVNIASIGGLLAVPHLAPYSASKFALVGLSDAVRAEVGKDGIRVTTVCPGLMRTGSSINALMKGRHSAEFTWFGTLSSTPLLSIDAERAARRIVNACRLGAPHLTITPQARLAAMLDRIAPNAMARLMALSSRVLPGPAGVSGNEAWKGRESRSPRLPRVATLLSDRAAVVNNELVST